MSNNPNDYPIANYGILDCDDGGGPMSYYTGEVTGITQIIRLQRNIAAGRPLSDGFEDVPSSELMFDFEEPVSKIRKIGRMLLK